ncbi:MAG: hypothetical protein MI748_18825 [Opitutales bacterium]|nr:hypothetical protein [Opitutales bacterium]
MPCIILTLLILVQSGVRAQDLNTEEDVYELSPFVVDTTDDIGYLAQNSLAGSRLNSSLKDISASIEVFTPEFISDIGANDIGDILEYGNNTQAFLGDDNSGMQQDFKNQAQVANRYNVRGLSADRARDYFRWNLPMDTFSIDRVDQSRGPNSILFGVGSAGGIVNTSTKRAMITKNVNKLYFQVGSDDLWRTTLDVNRVLIEGKLAIRLNLMHHEAGSWREWEYTDKEGYQAALTYRPFENTTIRVDYQTGEQSDIASRTYLVLNKAYYWDQLGRPTYDPSTLMAQRSNSRWYADLATEGGAFDGWKVNDYRAANDYGPLGNFDPSTNDWGIWFQNTANLNTLKYVYVANDSGLLINDRHRWRTEQFGATPMQDDFGTTVSLSGPGGQRELDYRTFTVFAEQKVTDNFFVEAAYNKTSSVWTSYNTGNTTQMDGDPNSTYFYGGADGFAVLDNPYAGHYYFDEQWKRNTRRYDYENLRLTASYELDAGKWGFHRIAGMYAKERTSGGKEVGQLHVLYQPGDTIPGVSDYSKYVPENGNFKITTRHYVTNENDPADFRNASWEVVPSTVQHAMTGEYVDIGWIRNTDSWKIDDFSTSMIAMQNYWFDGNLVTTVGIRRDSADIQSFSYATDTNDIDGDGNTSETLRDPNLNNERYLDKETVTYEADDSTSTKTYGAIWHIRPWVSAGINYSDNTQAPGSGWGAPNMTEPIDPVAGTGVAATAGAPGTGEGWDYTLKLDLHESKYFLTLTYYEVEATGNLVWQDAVDKHFNSILGRLSNSAGFEMYDKATGEYLGHHDPLFDSYTQVGISSRDEDFNSKGYEISLVANPTNSLRLRLNYSYTERDTYNVYQRVRDYTDRWREWLPGYLEGFGVSMDQIPIHYYNDISQEWKTQIAYHDTIDDMDSDPDKYMMYADDIFDYNIDYWLDELLEGYAEKFGQRPHKFNFFADYSFKDGPLKGTSVGLGVRWQSGAEVGFKRVWNDTTQVMEKTTDVETTDAILSTDLKVSYKTQINMFGKKIPARFQLNIANLLDDSGASPARTSINRFNEEFHWRLYNKAPRSFRFSGTFEF